MARTMYMLAAAGLAFSMLAMPAMAMDDKDQPALKGPEVKDRNVPGVEGTFGEGAEKRRFVNENRLPPRVFREAMTSILSEDAPADVRVGPEQKAKYESWMKDFEKQTRDYMQQHREEIAQLRKKAGEFNRPKKPGQPPEQDAMAPEKDGQSAIAAREQYQKLMAGAPKVEDLYTKIWTDLSPAQQKALDAEIQTFRDRQSEERQEQYVRQKLGRKGPEGADKKPGGNRPPETARERRPGPNGPRAGGPEGGQPGGPGMDRITPEKRDRLLRLFARMSPEQQDELLRRIEERMQQGEQGAPNRRRPARDRGPAGEKPAPPMDEVRVPQSEPKPD